MKHTLPIIALALLAPALAGCAWERIDIYSGDDFYPAMILSGYDDVTVEGRTVVIHPGGQIVIAAPYVTQWLGQFEVRVREGTGVLAHLRTTPEERGSREPGVRSTMKGDEGPGLTFRYATDGCALRTAAGTTPIPYNADNEKHTLSFYHEAELLTISVDCRRVHAVTTTVPATEYVIFEALPGSTVELTAVDFFESSVE